MDNNVSEIPTEANITPDKVLIAAMGELDMVLVIGWKDNEMWFSGSTGDAEAINFLIDKAKMLNLVAASPVE